MKLKKKDITLRTIIDDRPYQRTSDEVKDSHRDFHI